MPRQCSEIIRFHDRLPTEVLLPAAGTTHTAAAQTQATDYTVEWQAVETAQPDQLATTFGSPRSGAATMLSASYQRHTMYLHPCSPALGATVDGLRFLQQVVLPAPAAGRTLRLAARQAPAALSGPASIGSRRLEAAVDGLQGLLRVAAAEVHGLSCANVMLDPSSRLPDIPQKRQQKRCLSAEAQAPAYADGHGAACMGSAWSAPRLLPAAASGAAHGQSGRPGIHLQGGLYLRLRSVDVPLLSPVVDNI